MKDKLRYISNNMKLLRKQKGFTQDKMAKLLEISIFSYCQYEINPQKVKIETFQQMANILECKLSDFFVECYVTKSNDNV